MSQKQKTRLGFLGSLPLFLMFLSFIFLYLAGISLPYGFANGTPVYYSMYDYPPTLLVVMLVFLMTLSYFKGKRALTLAIITLVVWLSWEAAALLNHRLAYTGQLNPPLYGLVTRFPLLFRSIGRLASQTSSRVIGEIFYYIYIIFKHLLLATALGFAIIRGFTKPGKKAQETPSLEPEYSLENPTL